jgi:proton-dependent oligopeptide transporter, POT family
LIQYSLGRKYLRAGIERLEKQPKVKAEGTESTASSRGFTTAEWKRLAAVVVFFLFASLFWGGYEQAGSTLNLFADRYTRLSVFGYTFPSSWFQSVPAIFVITMAPIFAWLWVRLGPKEPPSPVKFTIALVLVGLSFLLLVPGSAIAQNSGMRVSPLWLVGVYFLQVAGELCLNPVGMSMVTKLSPQRMVGMMMGVWFLAIAAGDFIAGWLVGFFKTLPLLQLFGAVAAVELAAAFVLFLLIKPLKRLMGGVH